jgi:hypothetical protein
MYCISPKVHKTGEEGKNTRKTRGKEGIRMDRCNERTDDINN